MLPGLTGSHWKGGMASPMSTCGLPLLKVKGQRLRSMSIAVRSKSTAKVKVNSYKVKVNGYKVKINGYTVKVNGSKVNMQRWEVQG